MKSGMAMNRPTGLPDDDDQTLGAKVAHFVGIAGYRLPLSDLLNKNIASTLGLSEENWSRSKRRPSIDEARLSRLARHLRFEEWGLTYEALLVGTLGEFKEILRACGAGSYGGSDADVARTLLMTSRSFKPNGISIQRFAGVRAGGMGGNPDAGPVRPVFRPGDSAILSIRHPLGGHLVVLNDCPDGEVVCLMPSHLAPGMQVHGEVTRLPTDSSASMTIPIGAEATGRFRLFSIWTSDSLATPFLARARSHSSTPPVLAPGDFRELADLAAEYKGPCEIRSADYAVERD
jgi:hypothetical protein